MANPDHVKRLLETGGCPRGDLVGVDLTGAFLEEANLWQAKLEKADLTGAILKKAKLTGAESHRG